VSLSKSTIQILVFLSAPSSPKAIAPFTVIVLPELKAKVEFKVKVTPGLIIKLPLSTPSGVEIEQLLLKVAFPPMGMPQASLQAKVIVFSRPAASLAMKTV